MHHNLKSAHVYECTARLKIAVLQHRSPTCSSEGQTRLVSVQGERHTAPDRTTQIEQSSALAIQQWCCITVYCSVAWDKECKLPLTKVKHMNESRVVIGHLTEGQPSKQASVAQHSKRSTVAQRGRGYPTEQWNTTRTVHTKAHVTDRVYEPWLQQVPKENAQQEADLIPCFDISVTGDAMKVLIGANGAMLALRLCPKPLSSLGAACARRTGVRARKEDVGNL